MIDRRSSGLLNLPELLLRRLLGLRNILTSDFFSFSESIWGGVSTVCLLLFLVSLLLLGTFISVRTDSIRLLFGVAATIVGLIVLHAINQRLFETLVRFVRSNQLIVTDSNMTDAFGAVALLAAFFGLPVGIYYFLDTSEPLAVYAGATTTLVLLYVATYLLNPRILNIWVSGEASIGDNGVTYLSILNGIGPARLATLAYGIAMLNGFLIFAQGLLEKLATSSIVDISSAQDLSALGLIGTGAIVIIIATIVPLPLFLYIVIIHVLLDALSGFVRAKNFFKPRDEVPAEMTVIGEQQREPPNA